MSENTSVSSETTPAAALPKPSTGSNLSVFILLCSVALAGCFFLPWINIGGVLKASGYSYALADDAGIEARIFLAIPAAAILTIIMGFVNQKQCRGAARITGLLPVAGLVYAIIRYGKDVTQILGAGAWLTLSLGVALFVIGCLKPKS